MIFISGCIFMVALVLGDIICLLDTIFYIKRKRQDNYPASSFLYRITSVEVPQSSNRPGH